jgi:4-alpha-glucanotransferase
LSVDVITKKFKQQEKYFLYSKGEFKAVKLKKKSLRNSLPKRYAKRWKRAVKKNRLSLKSEEDFIYLLNMISTKYMKG